MTTDAGGTSAHERPVMAPYAAPRDYLGREKAEPAAWIDGSGHPRHLSYVQGARERQLYGPLQPLYRQRVPLSDEQIDAACADIWGSNYGCILSTELQRVIARAIERAHGVGPGETR